MEEMAEEMGRFIDEFVERPGIPVRRGRGALARGVWAPAVEMIDRKDELLVKAELPGIEKKDISVSVSGDVLTIKGERKMEKEVKEEDYYCCESVYGKFFRAISLPMGVDTEKIKAEHKHGILEVHLPKTKEVKEKVKEISVE
jgi:HSP20 family protein